MMYLLLFVLDEFTIFRSHIIAEGNSENNGYLAWVDETKQYNRQVIVIVSLLCLPLLEDGVS